MSGEPDLLGDEDSPAAPPQANGELVFTAPWQSRIFATTMRLHEQGRFEWERFRQGLIAEIAAHEVEIATDEDYDYWCCWRRALEALLTEVDLVTADELVAASAVLAAQPPDH